MAAAHPITAELTPFEFLEKYPVGATITMNETRALLPSIDVTIPAGSVGTIKAHLWPDARRNLYKSPALLLELNIAVSPAAVRSVDRVPWFAVDVRDPDHLARVQAHALATSEHTARNLAMHLAHLQGFTLQRARHDDPRQTRVILLPDTPQPDCLSFFWCWVDGDGKRIMNGGLIYRQAGECGREFPEWSSHT